MTDLGGRAATNNAQWKGEQLLSNDMFEEAVSNLSSSNFHQHQVNFLCVSP